MNREEERLKQINAVSMNYGYQKYSDGINSLICAEDFLNGAEWADQHPRKGLWDANKVLAWISQNIESYCKLNAKNFNNLLFDLGKAMEE